MSNFTLVWHFLIFGVLPYVVIAVLVVGSLLRFILAPYSWKSQSSEILDKKDLFWGANLFHIGVIFLFCGHCFGLFTPTAWLNAVGLTPDSTNGWKSSPEEPPPHLPLPVFCF